MRTRDKYPPVIIYFSAGWWKNNFPIGELRYPIHIISKKHNVIFVEPPLTLRETLTERKRIALYKKYGPLRKLPGTKMIIFTPRLMLPYSVRLPLSPVLKKMILKINSSIISRKTMQVFRKIYPEKALPDIVFGTIFHHAELVRSIRASHNLAIINDNFPESPVFTEEEKLEIREMEKDLISSSEYFFTTSGTLFEEKKEINPNAVMMENGVSSLFLPENRERLTPFAKECPLGEQKIITEIGKIPGPKVGYLGSLNVRLMTPFIEELLKLPGKTQFCFVGNVDDSFPEEIHSRMKEAPNFRFFPFLSHALAPLFFDHMDALLLPFELTDFSKYINPLKFSEYLSSGKPVISTPLPEVKRIIKNKEHLVYIVENVKDVPVMIKKALGEDSKEKREERLALARTRTWIKTSQKMRTIVDRLLQRHG